MKPAIVIPSYWASGVKLGTPGGVQCYDHAIPIDEEKPSLDACLASLEQVLGLKEATVIILVVAPTTVEERAVHRVKDIVDKYPWLPRVVIVDSFKAMVINSILAPELPADIGEPISLRGYGAIRNIGLICCCATGCDAAIFLDDDEVVLDEDFLANAVYGFGQVDRSGMPIMAKSGYFLDRRNSALADRRNVKFYDRYWAKRAGFNEWMTQALAGPRISRSPYLCGGCHALHAGAFTRVAFDPWITRGEDEDYLINLRFYGIDVWFDNRWRVRHLPPRQTDTAARFLQDVYRWTYERRKIEVCNSNIDLQKVSPSDLMPYPGPWISPELPGRARKTAFWRSIMTPEHADYRKIFNGGLKAAEAYAEENCMRYLSLQSCWRSVTTLAWLNGEIENILEGDGMLNASVASRMAARPANVGLADVSAPGAGAPGDGAARGGDGEAAGLDGKTDGHGIPINRGGVMPH
ncbi:MAG: hypothetical protein SOI26_02675 [Coriobacteriales bacterium]|jgi:hypothetical protein